MIKNNLKELIKAKGLIYVDVATYLGVSQQQISKYVSGINEPSLESIVKLSKLLECSPP